MIHRAVKRGEYVGPGGGQRERTTQYDVQRCGRGTQTLMTAPSETEAIPLPSTLFIPQT